MRSHPIIQFTFLVLLCALSWSCNRAKTPADHKADTAALKACFATLEAERVTALRYQDWCRVLEYKGGKFGESDTGRIPAPGGKSNIPFTAEATADLERIWQTLKDTDSGVIQIEGRNTTIAPSRGG